MMARLEKFDRSKVKRNSVEERASKTERLVSLEVFLEIVDSHERPTAVGSPERRHEKVASPKRNQRQKRQKRVRNKGNSKDAFRVPWLLCHNCRLNNNDNHLTCSRCPMRFCRRCLLNRYRENIEQELGEGVRWVCPRCRGGCGAGCAVTCCNCWACRKMLGLQPAGHLPKFARSAGFNNMHNYLGHLETKESAAAIASRKKGRGWTSRDSCPTTVVNSPAWVNRGNRSTRFQVKNMKWGKRPEVARELCKPTRSTMSQIPVEQLPLLQTFLTSAQEIRQKLQVITHVIQNLLREEARSNGPHFQTADHLCTLEEMKDWLLELQSEGQMRTPEQTENKCLPVLKSILSLTQEIGRKVQVIIAAVHRLTTMPSKSHFPDISTFLLLGVTFISMSLKQVNCKLSICSK